MSKPFRALRAEMVRAGFNQQAYLAEQMGKSKGYVSARMTGKKDWTQGDQYWLMDELHIPYERMHEVFPPHGREVRDEPARVYRIKNKKEVQTCRKTRQTTERVSGLRGC